MKRQTLFLALLAIGLLTATTFFGCSNDDDWAEDEYSSLANMKMTRSGESDDYAGPHYASGTITFRDEWQPFGNVLVTVSWPDCFGYNAILSADVSVENMPDSLIVLHNAEAEFHRNTDIVGKYSIRIDSLKYNNPNVHNYGRYEYNFEIYNAVTPDYIKP